MEGEEEEDAEAETEATGPSDSCLTLDEEESSCDTVGPQTNGHAPSTEEESSSETPVVAAARTDEEVPVSKEEPGVGDEDEEDGEKLTTSHAATKDRDHHSDLSPPGGHAGQLEAARVDCVNGNESMDSVDSGSLETDRGEDSQKRPLEVMEHKEKHSCEPSQERHLQDGGATEKDSIPEEGEGEATKKFLSLTF